MIFVIMCIHSVDKGRRTKPAAPQVRVGEPGCDVHRMLHTVHRA